MPTPRRTPVVAADWCRLTGSQEKLLVAVSESATLKAVKDDKTGWTAYTVTGGNRTLSPKESEVYALVKHKLVQPHPQDPRALVLIFTVTALGMKRADLCVEKRRG